MPALFLNILKLVFVGMIYLFLWQIARAIATHMGGGPALQRSRRAAELVLVRSDSQAGMRVPVRDVVVIGRSDEADVRIDDPYASDFHLRVSAADGIVTVQDLGSTNGTYVNGRRITVPLPVSRGDAVQVGKTIMEVR